MIEMPDFFAVTAGDQAIVAAIIAARLLIPLLIPRIPLAIVVVLIIDAADQTILQLYTDVDTTETGSYQGYDKALDVYYLSIAYLSTMRNWTSRSAFRIGQFLLYYRLVGVALFELIGSRSLLFIFPNTFEYYFIVYEIIRLRYEPSRFSTRFWLLTAAVIWVFIKLPQEYWIHVAQLDFTDAVRDHPAFAAAVVVGLLILLAAVILLRRRLPTPDRAFALAADPLPFSLREAYERHLLRIRDGRFLSLELLEKAGLLALICIIFTQILPDLDASALQVALGVTAIVLANTAVSLFYVKRGGAGIERAALHFVALVVLNLVFIFLTSGILGGGALFPARHGLFFAGLIVLVLWLYDRYQLVYDARFAPPSV